MSVTETTSLTVNEGQLLAVVRPLQRKVERPECDHKAVARPFSPLRGLTRSAHRQK